VGNGKKSRGKKGVGKEVSGKKVPREKSLGAKKVHKTVEI